MTKTAPKTPVRRALREGSALLSSVADGLGAVKNAHRGYFDHGSDATSPTAWTWTRRWSGTTSKRTAGDYLLGHAPSGEVVAVEPHSAKQDEITRVIQKRAAAREQLRTHLREGARVTKWLWVASGKVHFADTEKARLRLDQNGIEFVGTKVAAKHLPDSAASSSTAERPRAKAKARR